MTPILQTSRLTRHAHWRLAQRGIVPDALALLLAWGHDVPAGAGCVRRVLQADAAAELLAEEVPLALIEVALHLEAIVGEAGDVVTVYARSTTSLRPGSRRRQGRLDHRRGRRA